MFEKVTKGKNVDGVLSRKQENAAYCKISLFSFEGDGGVVNFWSGGKC
jgi:hypothetical protein